MTVLERQIEEIVEVPEEEPMPVVQPGVDVCGVRSGKFWAKFQIMAIDIPLPGPGFDTGVMLNVRFRANYHPGGVYTGHAIGELLEGASPKREQLKEARALKFMNCVGAFVDDKTGKQINKATALFLLPGLHARYIP